MILVVFTDFITETKLCVNTALIRLLAIFSMIERKFTGKSKDDKKKVD